MNNNTTSFFLSLSLSSAFLLLSAFSASSYNWIIDFMCATLQSSCFNKDNKNRISTSSASCSIKAAAPASPISISLRAPSRWNSLATLTSHLFFRTDFNYYWQLKTLKEIILSNIDLNKWAAGYLVVEYLCGFICTMRFSWHFNSGLGPDAGRLVTNLLRVYVMLPEFGWQRESQSSFPSRAILKKTKAGFVVKTLYRLFSTSIEHVF